MVVQLMEVFKVSDTYISCSNNGIGVCIASMTKQQLKSCDAHCDTASNLEFDKVCKDLTMFGEEILCKKYFDSIKYKLYILNANDIKRRAVQSNLYDIILTLCGLWLPIIPFTLEEIWQYIYHRTAEEEKNIFNNVTHLKDISVECNDIIMKWKRIY